MPLSSAIKTKLEINQTKQGEGMLFLPTMDKGKLLALYLLQILLYHEIFNKTFCFYCFLPVAVTQAATKVAKQSLSPIMVVIISADYWFNGEAELNTF
ncbi:MAG: hypothetical protein R2788_11515 [Saprospiraceae bacterium]